MSRQGQVMGVIGGLIFLLPFQLLHVAKCSMVWLNKNGYEDLVVAIDPQVPEDDKIIINTVNMIKNASNHLFEMTKHHFFFKSVKLIIPKTWKKTPNYSKLKTESYNKADVIISDKNRDDPYTSRHGGCKEKGQHIHFTPNFLLSDYLTNVYGDKGRVFVHEWAHFRWGVFDEYNTNEPFYVSRKSGRIKATSCPDSVTGQAVFQDCSGDKCEERSCSRDGRLYEKGCRFIPDRQQNIPCSVMYAQYMLSATEFCDKNTHNIEAPNMQNRICNHKSTWEVIMESDDFRNSAVVNASVPPSETTFMLLQAQDRAVALVLDVSTSMKKNNRIRHLYNAARVFLLHVIEIDSWVAIVTFDTDASEKAPLQQITNDAARRELVQYLPAHASGQTNICAGIRKGLKLIKDKMTTTYGSEIVLLTDGLDPNKRACFPSIKESGAKIHTIAVGPDADEELEELSKQTGGLNLYATDGVVPRKLAEAFSAITSGNGDIAQQSLLLESKDFIVHHSEWMNTTVPVDKTVGNDTFFSISWNESQPFFFLKDPKGKIYGSSDFTINPSSTAGLAISGTAEVGEWEICIKNVHEATQTISVTAISRPACSDVPPVHAAAHMHRANRAFNPVVIYAEVSQGFLPVLGATVIATIEKDGAAAVTLELLDNGAGADMKKNDGVYSRYFTSLQGTGRYSLKVTVHGKNSTTRFSLKQNLASSIPGYRENGKIHLNALRPKFADEEIQLGSFSRISVNSVVVNTGGDSTIYPPCKVTDLHAHIANQTIILSWTAPGGDLDNGKADYYIIKSSENLLDLRDHFDHATSVNSSYVVPKEAGREETFEIKSENFITKKDTIIYFALRAVDDTNLMSEVSNIAQATWFIPPEAFDYESNSDGANSTVIAVTVAVCIVVVCAIVSSTLCVLQKRKGRLNILKEMEKNAKNKANLL
ncbi:calcium-activated chloride channel regulator 1-like [Porphyrio hochstetteri]